jgi:membrane-bound lytic murein transglycosylase D
MPTTQLPPVVDEPQPQPNEPQSQPLEQIKLQSDSVKTEEIVAQVHTVAPGETLYAIAKRYQLNVNDLATWNNVNLSGGIKPGQVLTLIPKTVTEEAKPNEALLHTVKTSDTLYSIAREYGVTIKELMDWNQKKDFNLTIGEKLRIVKKQ